MLQNPFFEFLCPTRRKKKYIYNNKYIDRRMYFKWIVNTLEDFGHEMK